MRFAVKLYPAAWRARYGQEFEALLEDIGPVWRDVWNVLGGALKMQMMTWSFWKLVPALGVAGTLVAGVAAFTIRAEYESTGVMRVKAAAATPDESSDLAAFQRFTRATSRVSLAKIITEENLYPREVEKTTIEDAVAKMQRNVQLTAVQQPGHPATFTTFMLRFRYPDPSEAQRVTRKLMAQMVDPTTVEVLDTASLPREAIMPNRPVIIGMGLAAGLLLGLVFAARRWGKWLAPSAVVGALLSVVLAMALASYRPNSHPQLLSFAILGFLAGLLFGLVAVGVRRWRLAR
jgi:uncharacterized protein involved in exopolysaccharide biosynthesis